MDPQHPTDGAPSTATSPPERTPFWRNPLVWYVISGIVTITLLRPLLRYEPEPPPVLGQAQGYTLVDTSGRRFGSSELAGSVYVAGALRTRDDTNGVTAALQGLQQRYAAEGVEGIRLVGIALEPEVDSPDRLAQQVRLWAVDGSRWTLLSGVPEQVSGVLREAFTADLSQDAGVPPDPLIRGKLVLVDSSGHVRGFYATDRLGVDEVFHRSRHVLKQERIERGDSAAGARFGSDLE